MVVLETFNNAQTATWALLVKLSSITTLASLSETTTTVKINETLFAFTTEEVLIQLNKHKGILIDYDESNFQSSQSLTIEVKIMNHDGATIAYSNTELSNWDMVGVAPVPVDLTETLDNGVPRYVVYHLDDIDPTGSYLSSFGGLTSPTYITEQGSKARWVGGVEQNHGNAIDIGYYYIMDPTRTIIKTPKDMVLLSSGCSPNQDVPTITECNFHFELPISAFVLDSSGNYLLACQLEYEWNHLAITPEDIPNYNSLYNARKRTALPKGTALGIMEIRGNSNAELHAGIYCPICIGSTGCDPYWAANDPHSLILPMSMFFSPQDRKLILDSLQKTQP